LKQSRFKSNIIPK